MSPLRLERLSLKNRTRETMRRFMPVCLLAAAAALAASLVASLLQGKAGGLIFPGLLDPAQFPVNTGIWGVSPELLTDLGLGDYAALGGILAALRVEAAGAVMVYILPWAQLEPFFITVALVFLLTTPLRYGALSHLWSVAREKPANRLELLRWYLDLRLAGKALLLELLLSLWSWLVQLLCMVPSMVLMFFFAQESGDSPVWMAVLVLMMGGLVLGYWLALLAVPIRLLAAQEPKLGLGRMISQGLGLMQGRRKEFFFLWLSFLPWQIASTFTYHVLDLVLFPYQNLTGMLFLDRTETAPTSKKTTDSL